MRISLSLAVFLLTAVAFAQAPVPGPPPQFGLASAIEKDGKVVVEVFERRNTIRMKVGNGGDVFVEQPNWLKLTTGTLGTDIRAYRPDGKAAKAEDVLKALAKPRGVVYFVGFDKARPVEPDPFYLGLLKEGTIALAFDRPDLVQP